MNLALESFIKKRVEEKLLRESKFPLKLLLIFYSKNYKLFYIDHFKAFKLIIEWLGPIDIPAPAATPRFNRLLYNYEQQEIAKILNCDPLIIQQTILELDQND